MTDKAKQEATAVTTPPYASDALTEETVDAVVIGGGAAGLNGALILARSRRSVVVIDSGSPRNAPADAVHGLLALDGTPPAEILRRGREQVRHYGGHVVSGQVVSAQPTTPSADGDLRFTLTLADGRHLTTRRILVATGLKDVLPEVPGLAEHWGHSVVHCPYCHGWEVRDQPIGILATGPASIDHAYLFRQLTDDLTYFTHKTDLDEDNRTRFAARNIRVIDTPIAEIVNDDNGTLTGVRLTDGQIVTRRVISAASRMQARTQGLEGLNLPVQDGPKGRAFTSGTAGTTEVPGVWVAGNATDLVAQVGNSAAAGALAAADINKTLAIADTDAALQS
ncbi:NAD(P)/FAD-dependent oxidoreductase [Streptomyces sp. ME02-8801-2C]|uniref:NAD(P)/FAD-dependent oxidoreductase n=1 Tax=Streptomyces sp. ME02-8801-2C TaxID=3028680 RepID=UPI0029AF3B91|nr:NAD(P)/FAD-dependent oxidoreductase [Streptomyces sp. ME02-8801-2C]MDX3458918.1 NAD(P)/FAD-dependent oxidoreductase [Streptomyces sp. ME02-8801-2C]